MLEAVLVDVVAQAEHQRRVDLRGGGSSGCGDRAAERGRGGGRIGPRRGRRASRRTCGPSARLTARWRGSRRRTARGPAGSTVARMQLLGELATAAPGPSPSWSITSECPSNTSSSWPPTRLQNGHRRHVVPRALDQHPLALGALARVVGRGGDVDQQRRAGQRLVGGRRPRLPDVLADGQADRQRRPARSARRRRRPGSSAARRRRRSWGGTPCGRSPATRPPASTAHGVVDIVGRAPGSRRAPPIPSVCSAIRSNAARASAQEVLLEQQVLGRVAGDGQLAGTATS